MSCSGQAVCSWPPSRHSFPRALRRKTKGDLRHLSKLGCDREDACATDTCKRRPPRAVAQGLFVSKIDGQGVQNRRTCIRGLFCTTVICVHKCKIASSGLENPGQLKGHNVTRMSTQSLEVLINSLPLDARALRVAVTRA